MDEELKEEALQELQQEAVVKIQTRARGVLVRKKMPISDTERRRRRRKRNSRSPENVEMGVYEDPDEIGEWPQEIDLELLDDWQELNQLSTALEKTVTHTEFLSRGRLRVFCGTWNMHAKKPTDDLRQWIRLNKYHIVAVGSEECVNSIAKSVVFTSKKSWEGQLRTTLGGDYVLVSSHALTAIHNIVFVHSSLLPLLGNIQSDAVATGLGNQLGNKGGVGISFTVGATSFAFINCHFEAHQRNVARRNENFHRISHELKLSPTGAISSPTSSSAVAPSPGLNGLGRTSANRFSIPTVGAGAANKRTVCERFDRVFWYGDLNYRINGTRRMVDTLLLRNQHEVLLANDQLQREMQAGRVFAHFREGQLHFRPTYKFDKRSDAYDSSAKQRIPSWTDRVLFLSNDKLHDVELLSYRSQTDFRSSDHRPVCAVFQVNFRSAASSSLQDSEQFDWYQRYGGLKELLNQYVKKTDAVLMAGAGNSRLSEEMVNDGYQKLMNVDVSEIVVKQMAAKYEDRVEQLQWQKMNMCSLDFADETYDAVVDKGTMDSVLCGEGSTANVAKMCQEIHRVLKPNGVYLIVSYGVPDNRLSYLENKELQWKVTVHTVPKPTVSAVQVSEADANAVHYIYVCQKGVKTE
ncbi:putative methyltransferase [Phytophthora cinnamomi]|uniref:putative methyltransferase n=1 Tax=Phytophthora cinnamomi TaxID=4785 RepID=UPI00355A1F5D|nr:putative methyltransferase [Phytophthora cinnamomi]